MHNFFTILSAMFKNKLRFDQSAGKGKKAALFIAFGMLYLIIVGALVGYIVLLGEYLWLSIVVAEILYLVILLAAAAIVLVFGIIHLVSTLYLAKDTDFYSTLPVKPVTVFAAKLAFVYLFETAIVVAILLPLIITFGIMSGAWAWFYILTILAILIVPSLPLAVAAIFAIPVMYIASKLKNRNIVSLIFYIVLYGGGMVLYFVFIFSSSYGEEGELTPEQVEAMVQSMQVMLYVFYPYAMLACAALGIPQFGLGLGASTAVCFLIFLGISLALIAILLLCGNFLYGKSVTANNQTYNSATVKKGEFRSRGSIKALIKREYMNSLRTTQTAFQCYAVYVIPIIFSVVFGVMFGQMFAQEQPELVEFGKIFSSFLTTSCLTIFLAAVGNASITSFSREGKDMAMLKSMPVSAKQVVKAKTIAWLIPAVVSALVAVAVGSAINFDLEVFLLSLFSMPLLASAFVFFGVLWDLRSPKLNWTDPTQAIKHNTNSIVGQVICMGVGFVVTMVFFILIMNVQSLVVLNAVFWSVLYGFIAVFAVVDFLLYRKAETLFDKLEV